MKFASLAAVALVACTATLHAAEPLRLDLSATTGRSDAKTFGWQNWEIGSEEEASTTIGTVKVTLRGVGAPLEGFLYKPGLPSGATLVADGVRCQGEAIELIIEGLPAGPHSLAAFHNVTGDEKPAALRLNGPNDTEATATASTNAETNNDGAATYVKFDAAEGEPTKLRLTAEQGSLVLNALEIGAADPAKRAAAPSPANWDGHVDAESGEVMLSWRPVKGAKSYRLYVAHDRDLAEAKSQANVADDSQGELDKAETTVSIAASDSLTNHAWRVDTVMEDGEVIHGDVWTFRVRHLAFPGAEGYGRFARGGRGGRVLHVTNLDDAGPGSLRDAVEAEGPRTIVFDVSGRIVLKSRLIMRNDELTIAGQTAPGDGVCLSDYNLGGLGCEDLIVRYMRVRPGDPSGKTLDGMGLASCDHAIVDHCSISWTQDESFSSRGAKNITLQRTLISEALNIAGHKKYEKGKSHGFAASIGGDIGSFHHNLLAHCAGRNWSLAGSVDQANRHMGRLDIRNNVVFNWDHRTTDGGAKEVQFVNNYYKPGPASRVFHVLMPERKWVGAFGPQDYYVKGNVMEGKYGAGDRYAGVKADNGDPIEGFISDEPFFEPYVATTSAKKAYHDVLADIGCNVPTLDKHDQRVIEEVRTGKTTYRGSVSGLPGLPDTQEDVGGWDDYPEVHRPADWDADGDGMPGEWEVSHGLDPDDASDGAADADGDGYTNLEDYLNSLVK
ncbi:T9SS C-terminal target domain-containing protein [Botrimarina mediterranea]|uniref:Pectate lyase n=1 Tax=Botrimarina mediterranea TaxID=2528022 RepID=A0A518K9E5_9BACT|nr:T9SS C-terminal target domain-containing protein [Botrimarina mediterranea]QDV74412.1 hypothetical protein Spa11_26150 [Botrimarina mediterranea]QDV79008.1 hypothetical protein K2D_26170 [Planctomycetes bacterium K2D]